MFVFYGAVRGAPAVTPFPQVLRITMPSQESGDGPVNNHGILVWAGTGEGIRSSVFETGEWEVTFTRGELNKSSYGGTDTTTNTVTAVINRASGTVRFVYLNKGYVAEGVNAYMQESHRFADGDQVEFVPPELFGSETGFTDPPEGAYIEALELNEAGGGESDMSEVNEILVKSYLNLERDPVNEYHAASKNYVDTVAGVVNSSLTTHSGSTTVHVPTQNSSGYVFLSNTTTTSAGTWTAYGTAGTDVASGGTKLVTGGAVYAYLNSHYSAFADKSLVTSVASGNANAVTSGAVYTYVQNTLLNKSGSTGATALASSDDTKAPSSKLVAQYVAAQISAAASDYAGAGHKHDGADITSGTVAAARLPSASASAKGVVQVGSGLTIATTGDDNGKLTVDLGNGLTQENDGAMTIQLQSNSGLSLNASGLKVDTSSIKGDLIGTTQGKAPALDSAGKLSIDVMPARVIGGEYLGEVTNQAGMIAKSNATVGDFVKRTDKGTYWMLGVDGTDAYKTAANWFEYAGAVASVNGQVGTVTLSAADVSAIASSALVTSVSSSSTDATVPSALAVYSFVNTNYAPKTHNHNASAINEGTLAAARLPAATTSAKGAVIVGTGLKVSSGTISADFLAASSGVYDTTNTTKPITAAAAKAIADAAASSATAAAAKGKIFTITGNGTDANFTCTHGLGIANVLVQVYDSTGKQVLVAVENDTTTVTFKFAAPPASGVTYTAVILGVQEAS
ncbi:MAG: hypothetical protein ACOX6B_09245 [Thermoguttaceae bacterium]|jgi:hypothetical protein